MNSVSHMISNVYFVPNGKQCSSNTYAYVYPMAYTCGKSQTLRDPCTKTTDGKFVFYLCSVYFKLENEMIETILHEGSHHATAFTDDVKFNGGTAYGRPTCKNLAKYSMSKALKNADNFCYYIQDVAVNVPATSGIEDGIDNGVDDQIDVTTRRPTAPSKTGHWVFMHANAYCSGSKYDIFVPAGWTGYESVAECQALVSADSSCGDYMYAREDNGPDGPSCRCVRRDLTCTLKTSLKGNIVYYFDASAAAPVTAPSTKKPVITTEEPTTTIDMGWEDDDVVVPQMLCIHKDTKNPQLVRSKRPNENGDCQCKVGMTCYNGNSKKCPYNGARFPSHKYFGVGCTTCHCEYK